MVKTFFYGVLAGVIITGFSWFYFGRNNTSDLSSAIERTNGDLERVEQSINQFGSDFDRYAGKVAILNKESGGLWEQADSLRERSSGHVREYEDIQSELQYFSSGITSVEEAVRRSVVLSRDFADILYWYRRRGEEDETSN